MSPSGCPIPAHREHDGVASGGVGSAEVLIRVW